MKLHRPLMAAAAFMLLSSHVAAQVDPHHPEEGQPAVATGSAAPTEGSAEESPAPSSPAPAPAAPSCPQQQQTGAPAATPTIPMMQMMGQMQMTHMRQMHEAEMMHMQQMHQMETMNAMQMHGMQMHGMMPGMGMLKQDASGTTSDSSAAIPAPMDDGMASPTGSDPDVAFVLSMIPHHEGAIAMAEEVLRTGSDEEVQTWAREIIAAQQAEIAEMQAWLDRHPQ